MGGEANERDVALEWLRDVFDADLTKLLLSTLIILSVLPFESMQRSFAFLFFGIFAVEWVLRLLVLRYELRQRSFKRTDLLLLGLDLLATLSFLPLESLFGTRFLRLLRLSRMLMLLSYWRSVVREIWLIIVKRERRYQLIFVGSLVLILTFVSAIFLAYFSSKGIDFNEDGNAANETFFTALWWSFRQLQDPGNLVKNPTLSLAFVFSLLLTVAGLFVFAFIVGIGASVVGELVKLGRERRLGLRGHSLICNLGQHSRLLVEELVSYYAKSFRSPRIATMGTGLERPGFMHQERLRQIRYRQGKPLLAHDLARVDADRARRVILLGDAEDESSDSDVVSQILSVREHNRDCVIYAELFRADNVSAARAAGGEQTVPVLSYRFVALLMADLVAFPDLEELYKELLSVRGDEIYTCVYQHGQLDDIGPPSARLTPYGELVQAAHHQRGVLLLGHLVADASRPEGFRHVLTPGAAKGESSVPDVRTLRGFFGLASNFETLKSLVLDLSDVAGAGASDAGRPQAAAAVPRLSLRQANRDVRRVLVCGFHEGVVDFCRQVLLFFPGVTIYLMVPTREHAADVVDTFLARSGEPGGAVGDGRGPRVSYVRESEHERGGARLCANGADGEALGRLEVFVGDWSRKPAMREQPGLGYTLAEIDAVLLTYMEREDDPDARTSLGLLKLMQLAEDAPEVLGDGLHVLCEVRSTEKAELLDRRFGDGTGGAGARASSADDGTPLLRTTIVAAEHMRNAFLAQAVFVPGISSIFGEFLSKRGYELCQLEADTGGLEGVELDFGALLGELYRRERMVLVAVELEERGQRRLVLNPHPDEDGYRFDASALCSLFAVADVEGLVDRAGISIGAEAEPGPESESQEAQSEADSAEAAEEAEEAVSPSARGDGAPD